MAYGTCRLSRVPAGLLVQDVMSLFESDHLELVELRATLRLGGRHQAGKVSMASERLDVVERHLRRA